MSTLTVGANPTGRLADLSTAGRSITAAWPRTDARHLPSVQPIRRHGVAFTVRVQSELRFTADGRPTGTVTAFVASAESLDRGRPLPALTTEQMAAVADEVLAGL